VVWVVCLFISLIVVGCVVGLVSYCMYCCRYYIVLFLDLLFVLGGLVCLLFVGLLVSCFVLEFCGYCCFYCW